MRRWYLWGIAASCLALAAPVAAQQSESMTVAKELGALLDQKKLDSIAARLPGDENRFVAALYYPNTQLLVISAKYSVPVLLQEHIWGKRYRDVYTALHSGGTVEGKFFVYDNAANGLPPAGAEGQSDIVYENGVQRVMLNGDWKAQKLSKEEYQQRIDAADPRYAKLLAALVAELKGGGKG
jgi:hypothetical protein